MYTQVMDRPQPYAGKQQPTAEFPMQWAMLIPADGAMRSGEPMWNSPAKETQHIKIFLVLYKEIYSGAVAPKADSTRGEPVRMAPSAGH